MNDLLPLNRLPLNKAHPIILISCLTVSFEGIGGKVVDSFFLFEGTGKWHFFFVRLRLQLRGFGLQLGGFRLQLGGFSIQFGVSIVYNREVLGYNLEVLVYNLEILVFIVYKKKNYLLNG